MVFDPMIVQGPYGHRGTCSGCGLTVLTSVARVNWQDDGETETRLVTCSRCGQPVGLEWDGTQPGTR
jgi:ribosomal protein L37E